jgi:hypothetical protein
LPSSNPYIQGFPGRVLEGDGTFTSMMPSRTHKSSPSSAMDKAET